MGAERTFSTRCDELGYEIAWVARSLDLAAVDRDLRERVHVRFDVLLQKLERRLAGIRDGGASKDAWVKFEALAHDCRGLFSEILEFLHGALARSATLDEGICSIADGLADELRRRTDIPWSRLTILGEEALYSDTAEIIRMPFPQFSIWTLPKVGHEFGHLVANELHVGSGAARRYPVQELFEEAGRGPREEGFLQEYFADAFATWALGPAYLCLSVLFTFQPATADVSPGGHPSASRRVYMMDKLLAKIDSSGDSAPLFDDIRRLVADRWTTLLRSAGQPQEVTSGLRPGELQQLDELIARIQELLSMELPNARYRGWPRALRLADALDRSAEGDGSVIPHTDDELRDILCAGWWWRMSHIDSADRFSTRQIDRVCRVACGRILRVRARAPSPIWEGSS